LDKPLACAGLMSRAGDSRLAGNKRISTSKQSDKARHAGTLSPAGAAAPRGHACRRQREDGCRGSAWPRLLRGPGRARRRTLQRVLRRRQSPGTAAATEISQALVTFGQWVGFIIFHRGENPLNTPPIQTPGSAAAAELPGQAPVSVQGNTWLVFPPRSPGRARLCSATGTAQPEPRWSQLSLARQQTAMDPLRRCETPGRGSCRCSEGMHCMRMLLLVPMSGPSPGPSPGPHIQSISQSPCLVHLLVPISNPSPGPQVRSITARECPRASLGIPGLWVGPP